jgi:hypothetical protein
MRIEARTRRENRVPQPMRFLDTPQNAVSSFSVSSNPGEQMLLGAEENSRHQVVSYNNYLLSMLNCVRFILLAVVINEQFWPT